MRACSLSEVVAFVAISLLLLGSTGAVLAADPSTPTPAVNSDTPSFAIYPAGGRWGDYFQATIKPGEQATLQVILGNTGAIAFKARTLAVNAFTAPNGGFKVVEPGTKSEGVTTWLDYPETVYDLEPGKGVQVPLTIKVPKGTEPGQYLTALVMETADASALGNGSTFKQVLRQAVPVFITVPGPLHPEFSIGNIAFTAYPAGTALSIEIKNSGNVRVRPKGKVTLSDSTGAAIASAPISMDSVYAHDQTELTLSLPVLPSGTYKVSVDFADPDTGAKASVSSVPVTMQSTASPVASSPVTISAASATPQPSLVKIQFLNIAVTISNGGQALANARLTLSVTHDGKAVEDYPLSESLTLPEGNTTVQSRYIPVSGWSSGTWTFTIKLESIDSNTGAVTTIAAGELGEPIVVP